MGQGTSTAFTLLAVLVIALLVGGGVAGSERAVSPEWADELHGSIVESAAEYNTHGEVGFLENWLFGNDRVNLHVRDDEGAHAVYSLRLDEQQQMTDIEQGGFEEPTIRVQSTKQAIERISAADDTKPAVRQEIRSGRIRVERVFYVGVPIAIGGRDVLIGGGVAGGSLVLIKLGGINPVLSALSTVKEYLLVALRNVSEALTGTLTLLTVLEKLNLLENVQQWLNRAWTVASKKINDIFSGLSSQDETDSEQKEGDSQ